MLEMIMSVNQKIVYRMIDILVEINWLDKKLYQEGKVLWSDQFMNPLEQFISIKKGLYQLDKIYTGILHVEVKV